MPEIIPAQDLKAPLKTKKVKVKIIASAVAFREPVTALNFCMEQYDFNYVNTSIPSKKIMLDTKALKGDIAIVVIAFEFETTTTGSNVYNDEMKWLPAAIVAMGRLG